MFEDIIQFIEDYLDICDYPDTEAVDEYGSYEYRVLGMLDELLDNAEGWSEKYELLDLENIIRNGQTQWYTIIKNMEEYSKQYYAV